MMSFVEFVKMYYGNEGIDVNDLSDEDYEMLEDLYKEECNNE